MALFRCFLLLVLFCFLTFTPVSGQHEVQAPKYDREYIKSYTDLVTARFYLLREGIGFYIRPQNAEKSLIYKANIAVKFGIAAFYKWYGMGLAVKVPFIEKKGGARGKSSIIDLRVNAYGRALAAELSYQDYHGFYISNTELIDTSYVPGDKKYLRPDMRIEAYGGIFYYIPNFRKHSIRASFIQNEKQLKSSGSLLVVPSFLHAHISADSSVIPNEFAKRYQIPPGEQIVNGKFFTYGLSVGYSYTLVFLKGFYINMSMVPGVFFRTRDYESQDGINHDSRWNVLWLGRGAIGYNSDKFYLGFGGVFGFNNAPFPEGNISFHFDLNQYRFWIGTRFRVKKDQK